MGGRSRKFFIQDRWAWIAELSDSRLENYGKMTAHKIDQSNSDYGKDALNYELARLFEHRKGYAPEWDRRSSDYNNNNKIGDIKDSSVMTKSFDNDMTGYRYLKSGEKIHLGDEYLSFGQEWKPFEDGFASSLGEKWNKNMYPFRRKK